MPFVATIYDDVRSNTIAYPNNWMEIAVLALTVVPLPTTVQGPMCAECESYTIVQGPDLVFNVGLTLSCTIVLSPH